MNDLCADIGWRSLNKYGEQLCGDHVDIVEQGDQSTVVVLADGLGSGVKASILSTLTAKIISTMMAEGLPIEECVNTIAETLPVCSQRGIAYSTFTILRVLNNQEAEIIQYDNPEAVLFRDGVYCPIPCVQMQIQGKMILRSRIELQENDVFLLMSDGAVHAGIGHSLNFGWDRKDIISFMEPLAAAGFTAKALTSLLLEECGSLYHGKPGDDTTVCTLRIRRRTPVNLLIGPPANADDCSRHDGAVLLQGGQAHRLWRNHLRARGGLSARRARAFASLPRPGYTARRNHTRRGSCDRGRADCQPHAGLRQGLLEREHALRSLEQQRRRRIENRHAAV